MSENATVNGCLQLARSAGQHPCQSAIDADLKIKALTDALEQCQTESEARREDAIEARQRIEQLEAALRHYANREMWRKEPGNEYAGEFDCFDWDGDLADEPYEIAERALTAGVTTPCQMHMYVDTATLGEGIQSRCLYCNEPEPLSDGVSGG